MEGSEMKKLFLAAGFLGLTAIQSPAFSDPPAEAVQAGFTTLAGHYLFSDPAYTNPSSNWVDCADNDDTKVWHAGSPGVSSTVPCDHIRQKIDPLDNSTVLNLHIGVTDCGGVGIDCNVSIETVNEQTHVVTADFPPNWYMRTTIRMERTFAGDRTTGGPLAVWSWWTTPSTPAGLEVNNVELQEDLGGYANDGSPNWGSNCGGFPCGITGWTTFDSATNQHIPPGYDETQYNDYGVLITSNGTTSTYMCWYINDILQAPCQQVPSETAQEFIQRRSLIATVYATGGGPITADRDLDIKDIDVWTCSNPRSQCVGTQLFNDGHGLIYWHPRRRGRGR